MSQELIKLITVAGTVFGLVYEDGVTRVAISGHLLYGNKEQFKQLVADQLERGDRRFILDLTRCGYIDSSGWGVLVGLNSRIRKAGGELVLEGLSDILREFVEEAKLATLFTIRRTDGR